MGTTWDLPLFLMRCAATSGKSSKLCTPFPPNINQNHLPSITLRYVRDNLLSYLQKPKQNIRPTHDEMSMIEFLSCLQWTEHARISCDDQPTVHTKENSNSCKLVKVSLDLNRDALPHFQEQVQKSGGSTKVYHGTSIENAWSIVNYGLLQHPSLQKNGAMLGPGVYLSSKYDVAYYFATQNGSVKYLPTEIWKTPPSFWRILGTTTSGPTRSLLEESRKNGLEMMCYAVLECSIANPCKEDKDSTRNRIKQNDTYFVVKSPHDIHMENIHLIFEFHKRPTFWKWAVWALLAAAVFLWKASQVLREKNTTNYPDHFEL
jgi:Poly(ADP-ribose) polymerase catalytic domain